MLDAGQQRAPAATIFVTGYGDSCFGFAGHRKVLFSGFRPLDRFFVWAEGDALYLKRIIPPPVTEIVAQAPEGEPLSLDEINDIVQSTAPAKDRPCPFTLAPSGLVRLREPL